MLHFDEAWTSLLRLADVTATALHWTMHRTFFRARKHATTPRIGLSLMALPGTSKLGTMTRSEELTHPQASNRTVGHQVSSQASLGENPHASLLVLNHTYKSIEALAQNDVLALAGWVSTEASNVFQQ
eukprot:2724666-Amphidinium_carterae.1